MLQFHKSVQFPTKASNALDFYNHLNMPFLKSVRLFRKSTDSEFTDFEIIDLTKMSCDYDLPRCEYSDVLMTIGKN